MSWLQVSLGVTPQSLEGVEGVLLAHGAVAITLVSEDDEPVLEPAPGETPLWQHVQVRSLLPLDVPIARLRDELSALAAIPLQLEVDFVGPDDHPLAHTNFSVNEVFGGRIWLQPKAATATPSEGFEPADLVPLRLEPGLAFGSGSHPTTRMCLDWLGKHLTAGARVLDFGCGSGILGIAAALLGARAVGVDHDPQAVMASKDNAYYNGLTKQQFDAFDVSAWQAREGVEVAQPSHQDEGFDLVIANILAGPLQELAREFERSTRRGGVIVLSGILEEQAADVMAAYHKTEFAAPTIDAGWVLLAGRVQP